MARDQIEKGPKWLEIEMARKQNGKAPEQTGTERAVPKFAS